MPVKKKVGRPKKKKGGVVKRKPVRKGGAVKPSAVLGTISGIAGGASLIIPNPITPIISGIAGIGSAIAGLFGGALTPTELRAVMAIHANVQARKARR